MMNQLGMGIVISMRDMFSRNAGRIESSMGSLDATVAKSSERMTRNLDLIQKGTMMMGAGLALMAVPSALVASTAATQKALGEMASLGTKDLRALEDAAEQFSNTWAGSTKAEVIGAAYDVKSALANLSDEAVGTFSSMAALTAKATKATTQEMVGTFTSGYGIFKPIMREYSDMAWAEAFSGAMAQTVAAFKTTGPQMAEAIKNVGATAAASNIPLQEQLAILGQLQTTMPGSEAGTLYKSFIMKAAEAGRELGLPFVDFQGRLKGVVQILGEIQNRFPDLSQAAAQVQIKKAFGSDEAVKFVLQMSAGMGALRGNIETIEAAMKGGTATTVEMARAMNMDIGAGFGLLKQQIGNLFEIMGRTLLPIVTPLMRGISHVVLFFQRLAKSAPGLTRAVLGLALALGAVLVVAGAAMAAVGTIGLLAPAVSAGVAAIGPALAGVGAAFAAAFWPITLVFGVLVGAVYLMRRAWIANFAGIRDSVMGVWNRVRLAFQGIHALIRSLRDGTGEISAELAEKLNAAGLIGFVTTVFRAYTRVSEFMTGFSRALEHAFGRVRAVLEPPVRALVDACMTFYRALFSVFEVFGLVSNAADASSFETFGHALGTLLGVFVQIGAFIIRGFIYPMVFVIRTVALVVRAVTWMAKVIVSAFVAAVKNTLKYVLPLRLLIEAVRLAARVVYAFWQVLTGDISVVDGFKAIGKAVLSLLATPFLWLRDVVVGVFNGLKNTVTGIFRLITAIGSAVLRALAALPGMMFNAGEGMLIAFARGIWSTVTLPYQVLKRALGWLRRLLPFSDAETGPLSDLTASGSALLRTFAGGILSVIGLPAKMVRMALGKIIGVFSGVCGTVKTIGHAAVSAVTWPFRRIAMVTASAWTAIKGGAASAWAGMKSAGQAASGAFLAPFKSIQAAGANTWDGLKHGAANAWASVGLAAQSVRRSFLAPFRWCLEASRTTWSSLRDGAAGAWASIASSGQNARNAVLSPFRWIAGQAAQAWDSIAGAAAGLWNGLAALPARVAGSATAAFQGVATAASSAWGAVTSSVASAFDGMKSAASNATGWLAAPFESMASGASRAMGFVSSTIAAGWDRVRGVASGAAGIWDGARGAIADIGAQLPSGLSLSFGDTPHAAPSWEPLLGALDAMCGAIITAADALGTVARGLAPAITKAVPASVMLAGVAFAAPAPQAQLQPVVIQAPAQQPNARTAPQLAPPGVNVGAPAVNRPAPLAVPAMVAQPPAITNVLPVVSLAGVAVNAPMQVVRPVTTPPAFIPSPLPIQPPVAAPWPEVAEHAYVLSVIEPIGTALPPAPPRDFLSARQSDLLASTRGTDSTSSNSGSESDGMRAIRHLLETAIAEIRSLAERPIDVSVTTRLDGRQIAQSVYKDLRERKVRNYETL